MPHTIQNLLLTEEQIKIIAENGFFMPRVIDGQLCALNAYATTVGLVVNIDDISYERRYCFQDPAEAVKAFLQYTSVAEHASGNWIKCKGRFKGEPIDLFNPEWLKD